MIVVIGAGHGGVHRFAVASSRGVHIGRIDLDITTAVADDIAWHADNSR